MSRICSMVGSRGDMRRSPFDLLVAPQVLATIQSQRSVALAPDPLQLQLPAWTRSEPVGVSLGNSNGWRSSLRPSRFSSGLPRQIDQALDHPRAALQAGVLLRVALLLEALHHSEPSPAGGDPAATTQWHLRAGGGAVHS